MTNGNIEVATGYSSKVNIGNYENKDFSCFLKEEVPKEQSVKAFKELFDECKENVEKQVKLFRLEARKKERQESAKSTAEHDLSEM